MISACNKIIEFPDWKAGHITHDEPVAVLGAGPSMNRFPERDHFTRNYREVVGVNWIYLNYEVTYNVAVHYFVVDRAMKMEDCPCLVYSNRSADTLYQYDNPAAFGIRFAPVRDLISGGSTIITCLHLATLLTTGEIRNPAMSEPRQIHFLQDIGHAHVYFLTV